MRLYWNRIRVLNVCFLTICVHLSIRVQFSIFSKGFGSIEMRESHQQFLTCLKCKKSADKFLFQNSYVTWTELKILNPICQTAFLTAWCICKMHAIFLCKCNETNLWENDRLEKKAEVMSSGNIVQKGWMHTGNTM